MEITSKNVDLVCNAILRYLYVSGFEMYTNADTMKSFNILVYRGTCSYRGPNSFYLIKGNSKYKTIDIKIDNVDQLPHLSGASKNDFYNIAKKLNMPYVDFKIMVIKQILSILQVYGLKLDPLGPIYPKISLENLMQGTYDL